MPSAHNVESFYNALRSLLPEIESLEVWNDFDIEGFGFIEAQIFTDIGEQTIEWVSNRKIDLAQKLFEFFENSYNEFDDGVNAYIYTDFHSTIIASKDTVTREKIKYLMGPETRKTYDQLINLGFYAER